MLVSKLHPVREEWVQFFFARNLAFIFFQSQKDRGGISLDRADALNCAALQKF